MRGQEYDESEWAIHDKELSDNDIRVATKNGIPTYMQDKLKKRDYCFMSNEKWCNLLSKMEAKYNRKKAANEIKITAASKAAPANSDSDTSAKVPRKNKARTGFMRVCKQQLKYKFAYLRKLLW